ncbi:MAG: hypothetical protein ACR2J3_06480 [Aridibacter sp.]
MNRETKAKASIQISVELLHKLEKVADGEDACSELFEQAVNEFIEKLEFHEREQRDIEIINKNADELNKEAKDTLTYQDEIDILNRIADEQGDEILENLEYQIEI